MNGGFGRVVAAQLTLVDSVEASDSGLHVVVSRPFG